ARRRRAGFARGFQTHRRDSRKGTPGVGGGLGAAPRSSGADRVTSDAAPRRFDRSNAELGRPSIVGVASMRRIVLNSTSRSRSPTFKRVVQREHTQPVERFLLLDLLEGREGRVEHVEKSYRGQQPASSTTRSIVRASPAATTSK